MVVHLLVTDEDSEPPQVGFVVSKAIGNAVQRNIVKRRLRAAAATQVAGLPPRARAVVRALPAASKASYADLAGDLASCLTRAVARATAAPEATRPASGDEDRRVNGGVR